MNSVRVADVMCRRIARHDRWAPLTGHTNESEIITPKTRGQQRATHCACVQQHDVIQELLLIVTDKHA